MKEGDITGIDVASKLSHLNNIDLVVKCYVVYVRIMCFNPSLECLESDSTVSEMTV